MGDKTKIEWADATWNPVTGCSKVSAGCKNCYAERQAKRLQAMGQENYRNGFEVTCHPHMLDRPLRWKRPRRIFVCSMSDLFHATIPARFISAVFGVMTACPQHTFLILTKRPENMREWFDWARQGEGFCEDTCAILDAIGFERGCGSAFDPEQWPLPNVWLGVTAENQAMADERIPVLLQIPAAVRFVSAEPLLGPIGFGMIPANIPGGWDYFDSLTGAHIDPQQGRMGEIELPHLDWVIVGGETGPKRREMEIDSCRQIVEQCQASGVPVFVKQDSGAKPGKQGRIPDEWRVKQFPTV